ncbi:hypothetical protein OWR29_10485 [Actinoplanes sp. Pm04-4]|uniref:Uncharacterized protein n=1 Tax=Paractinoplanes pyxinae TaxID=2997416 RepID=A0ABT4AW23_9ACTN|nr:hypothetical protein [Actinoplanes pyxinae]MCY1138424.1 hypothetical protein [Actinoplanes pyxinae]
MTISDRQAEADDWAIPGHWEGEMSIADNGGPPSDMAATGTPTACFASPNG